jgi:hypothetical protein
MRKDWSSALGPDLFPSIKPQMGTKGSTGARGWSKHRPFTLEQESDAASSDGEDDEDGSESGTAGAITGFSKHRSWSSGMKAALERGALLSPLFVLFLPCLTTPSSSLQLFSSSLVSVLAQCWSGTSGWGETASLQSTSGVKRASLGTATKLPSTSANARKRAKHRRVRLAPLPLTCLLTPSRSLRSRCHPGRPSRLRFGR